MTICEQTGLACCCQPDEGVPCVAENGGLKKMMLEWRAEAIKLRAVEPWGYATKAYGWGLVSAAVYEQTLADCGPDWAVKLFVVGSPAPEGWKLVPPDVTQEMIDAAERVLSGRISHIWCAMLNAAPNPPTVAGGPDSSPVHQARSPDSTPAPTGGPSAPPDFES